MKIEDFTSAIAERFPVDCGVVSSVIEEYLVKKISHDQFKNQLRDHIVQRSQLRTGSPLESL